MQIKFNKIFSGPGPINWIHFIYIDIIMLVHNYTVQQRYTWWWCGDGLLCLFSDNTTDKTNQLNYIQFFVSATLHTLLKPENDGGENRYGKFANISFECSVVINCRIGDFFFNFLFFCVPFTF